MSEAVEEMGKASRGVPPREPGQRRMRLGIVMMLAALAAAFFFGQGIVESASEVRPGERFAFPGTEHLMGTDDLGRDTFSRVTVAMGVTGGVLAVLWMIAFVAGTAVGLARGLAPRMLWPAVDAIYRAWECFPMVLLGGALVILSGVSGPGVVILLGAMGAVPVSRRVGDAVRSIVKHDSYKAAAASCVPAYRLLIGYRVAPAFRAGFHGALAVLAPGLIWETSLGFVSSNVAVSSWSLGSIIREGSPYFMDAPRLVLIPAGILFGLVLFCRLLEASSASRLKDHLSLVNLK